MKKQIISHTVLFLLLSCLCINEMRAENYVVTWYNNANITIAGKKIRKGMQFSDLAPINFNWANGGDAFEVVETKSKKELCVCYESFTKKHAHNLQEFVAMGTRGNSNIHYSEEVFPLRKQLLFEAFSENDPALKAIAIWYDGENEIITPISYTKDHKYFIIDIKIYGSIPPRNIKLTIREINEKINWVNDVYKDIDIIYIPRKIKNSR